MNTTRLDPELVASLKFLARHPQVRIRLAAPRDKTVVYSGGFVTGGDVAAPYHAAWRLLAQAKASHPARFDYITLEERLRQFHVVEFGESLFDHANRVSAALEQRGVGAQALMLWRALSGIYVQGAQGKVRALILPGTTVGTSVFNLTEVKVLLREDVLRKIDLDPALLRDFRILVQAGLTPAPIVVM